MKKVPLSRLAWPCPENIFKFRTTAELNPSEDIIGQREAIESIKTGIEIGGQGYNIFISGLAGTGRKSTLYKFLTKNIGKTTKSLEDIVFLYNFDVPEEPVSLKIPKGEGIAISRSMEELLENLENLISAIYFNDRYLSELMSFEKKEKKEENRIFSKIDKLVKTSGFRWKKSEGEGSKMELMPVHKKKVLSFNELSELVEKNQLKNRKLEEYLDKKDQIEKTIALYLNDFKTLRTDFSNKKKKLDIETAYPFLKLIFDDLKKLTSSQEMKNYLDCFLDYMLANISLWKSLLESEGDKEKWKIEKESIDSILSINLAVNNHKKIKRPVIIENFPSENNLFGTVENVSSSERIHTGIKAGSLLKAHRGFLIIDAFDLLQEENSWQRLKRTLKTQRLEITPVINPLSSKSYLRPNPVEIDVKVVMIGNDEIYSALYYKDPDFAKIFKIKAKFEEHMPLTKRNLKKYANFIAVTAKKEKLPPFSRESVVGICDFAVKETGDKKLISTKFGKISDLVKESAYWEVKRKKRAKVITYKSVEKAIEKMRFRRTALEREYLRLIREDIVKIFLKGSQTGQVNALTVIDYDDISIGLPARITASVSPGEKGIVSIDRKSKLSGEIHTKGVNIICGYLRGKYAYDLPLSIHASICFEQSYNVIDGDSASVAEICVLISSITKIPVKQNFSVTGSVDQAGNVQAVGGINEKIEGFFKVCKVKNIKNGALILPEDNENSLMLDKVIRQSVASGNFSIYSVKTVDEVLCLILDVKGEKNALRFIEKKVKEGLKYYYEKSYSAKRGNNA
ncbi:AAA family ATPase [candidate division WOR-3 bacterium]|nr:AAA family ATPase [candidate division WOR-3 bacterium]